MDDCQFEDERRRRMRTGMAALTIGLVLFSLSIGLIVALTPRRPPPSTLADYAPQTTEEKILQESREQTRMLGGIFLAVVIGGGAFAWMWSRSKKG